jgi:hypothetical protein
VYEDRATAFPRCLAKLSKRVYAQGVKEDGSMKIQLTRDKNVDYDSAFSTFVDAHLSEALKPFENRISRVDVRFSIVGGRTRGGDDQRCHIQVAGDGMDSIVANDDAATLESALRLSTERMLFLLTSKLGSSGDRRLGMSSVIAG